MSTNTAALHQRIKTLARDRDSAAALLVERNTDLALKPDDAQLRADVETLEREIERHDRETARIESAIVGLARRNTAAERGKHQAQLAEHRAEVETTGKRITALAEKLIAQIEGIGPLLSEFATLSDTRREHARAVLRELRTGKRAHAHVMQYQADAARRTGVVSAVVAAAMWRAGIGRLGLDLDPWVTVVPPRDGTIDRYLKGDLRQVLQEGIGRAEERLAYGMNEALKSAEAEGT